MESRKIAPSASSAVLFPSTANIFFTESPASYLKKGVDDFFMSKFGSGTSSAMLSGISDVIFGIASKSPGSSRANARKTLNAL